MRITRIDNGDGKEKSVDIEEAREKIEGAGYYKKGTIDECIEMFSVSKNFTLRTPWAHWRFEL